MLRPTAPEAMRGRDCIESYLKGMSSRVVFNVVHRNDEWHVIKGGPNSCEGRFKSKLDAIDRARDLAMREEVAEMRIVKMDGSIQSEQTFGKDPHEVEGHLSY
jgi:hypothetical protein